MSRDDREANAAALPGAFADALAHIDATLARLGFRELSGLSSAEASCAARYYGVSDQYVKLAVSIDPRDTPYYCQVLLGEGRTEMPESDWNSISLRQLIVATDPSAAATAIARYEIRGIADLRATFEQACADLLKYASGFLGGSVAEFRAVRAVLTRLRQPYLIHRPDGRGHYITEIEPVSASLQTRFNSDT